MLSAMPLCSLSWQATAKITVMHIVLSCCRLEMALRNVFAGNIFDMGAAASAERYASSQGM